MRAARRLVLTRAYLGEILLHLVLVLGGITLLVSLGAAVRASATSQGAPVWIPLVLIPLMVGNALPYLVPATLLTAVVITYGRMAADGEATALRAAGVRPLRILVPALLAGAAVAAATYPLSSRVLPDVYSKMRGISYRLRFAALENTNPGASELHYRGLHMSWRGRDAGGAFRDVVLSFRERGAKSAYAYDPGADTATDDAPGQPGDRAPLRLRLRAERGLLRLAGRVLELQLSAVREFHDTQDGEVRTATAEESFVRIDLERLGDRPDEARKPEDYRSAEIRTLLAGDGPRKKQRARFRYTLWKRAANAAAAIPLALLGGVLGWRLRRGGFLAAFAAAFGVLLLGYYPLYYLGQGLQEAGTVGVRLAAFLPCIGLLATLLALAAAPRLRFLRRR